MLNLLGTVWEVSEQPPTEGGLSDADLVARARCDREAFALLYDRYLNRVYGYCYLRLGNPQAAEDAASMVFHNALQSLERFKDGSFRAWLFTIAHHVVVDTVRRRRPQAPLEAAGDPADASPTPEALAVAGEQRRSLYVAIQLLPEDQRRVVELRLAGFSGAEIATFLGRSQAAVKMLQFRAVERLRRELCVPAGTEEVRNGG